MSKYLVNIGLEMHCEISKTNTKVFSGAANNYSSISNASIRPVDMGFPGTLPVVNKEAVKLALKASMIMNCKQPEYIWFERKNYYYPDLPKGYQITQETKPIPVGIYGYVEFDCNGEKKKVGVNNIHLEEDSASLDHYSYTSTIDYNRAGVPLLELVTEPDLHSAEDAVAFIEHVIRIYQYANISEADTKKGQIRCDVNVSIRDNEDSPLGTKVEIKNINSIGGVFSAINYEIKEQTKMKENNTYDTLLQQTKRWDEESQCTIFMRSKVDAIDYKYFVEPNIPKYKVTNELLEEIENEIPVLASERKDKYINEYNLSEYDANILIKERDISDYFEKCVMVGINPKEACNWINVNIISYINKSEIEIKDLFLTLKMLKEIIDNIESGTISSKQAKEIFFKVLEENKEPNSFISKDNSQLSDVKELEYIIDEILSNSSDQIEQYKLGRTNLFDYFVGQVMKNTRGKANPNITKEILHNKLDK